MKIRVNEQREIVLSEVFNGIGIETDAGTFGIAMRDAGIEIRLGTGPWFAWYDNTGPQRQRGERRRPKRDRDLIERLATVTAPSGAAEAILLSLAEDAREILKGGA